MGPTLHSSWPEMLLCFFGYHVSQVLSVFDMLCFASLSAYNIIMIFSRVIHGLRCRIKCRSSPRLRERWLPNDMTNARVIGCISLARTSIWVWTLHPTPQFCPFCALFRCSRVGEQVYCISLLDFAQDILYFSTHPSLEYIY